jgi:hypothetical protein
MEKYDKNGRDGALRRPRRRAKRQATEVRFYGSQKLFSNFPQPWPLIP